MIERIIEFSIRNRFVVLILAAALTVAGVYAVLNTPVDAIPDLSENQVIVFTDWMGRSPREIEDQITYPLSLKLQGLAGVKAVRSSSEFNFSMITIIFEDNIDFYFARQRVHGEADPGQHVPAAGRRALPGPRRHGARPNLLVHGRDRARRTRSTPAGCGRSTSSTSRRSSTPRPAWPRWPRSAARRSNTRSTSARRAAGLRRHAGRAVRGRRQEQHAGRRRRRSRRTTPSTSSAASAGSRTRATSRTRSSRRSNGTPIYVKNVATVQLGTQFRRSVYEKDGNEVVGGVVLMRHGENPLAVTKRIKEKIQELQPGLPDGRAHRALLRPHAADPRRHPHAHRGDVARDDHRLAGDPADPDARPQRVRDLRHAAAGGAVLVPADVVLRQLGIIDIQANIMSLAGITISIGILVDQAIVMVENATHHLKEHFGDQQGHRRHPRAGHRACRTVGRPIFFSVMIMLCRSFPCSC